MVILNTQRLNFTLSSYSNINIFWYVSSYCFKVRDILFRSTLDYHISQHQRYPEIAKLREKHHYHEITKLGIK
jgi:hypothetical protein